MADETSHTEELLRRAAAGDSLAWGALLTTHQERLARMVAFRMDPRLSARLDPHDIVQEAFVEASKHKDDYFRSSGPLFLWLRGVVINKLLELHRHHPAHECVTPSATAPSIRDQELRSPTQLQRCARSSRQD